MKILIKKASEPLLLKDQNLNEEFKIVEKILRDLIKNKIY